MYNSTLSEHFTGARWLASRRRHAVCRYGHDARSRAGTCRGCRASTDPSPDGRVTCRPGSGCGSITPKTSVAESCDDLMLVPAASYEYSCVARRLHEVPGLFPVFLSIPYIILYTSVCPSPARYRLRPTMPNLPYRLLDCLSDFLRSTGFFVLVFTYSFNSYYFCSYLWWQNPIFATT